MRAVCTYPLFSGPGYPTVSFKFFSCRPLLPWQRILGQKLTTTRPALFSPTPLFVGPGYSIVSFNFFPCRLLLPWQRILGRHCLQLGPVKLIALSLHLPSTYPLFRARAIRWCHLKFSLADPRCYGNKFWDKIDYNSAPRKRSLHAFFTYPLFSGPGYAMVSSKFLL